jgi:predicted RNase H-like nuclease (RuvC/YqgF family)
MPFVYDTFKIDSVRFQNSNSYYVTKIDLYQEIFNDVKATLEKQKDELIILKKQMDSIRKDSMKLLKRKKSNRLKKPILELNKQLD